MKHPLLNTILDGIKAYLSGLYQDQLKAVIVYGSQARQNGHQDSDIDILVVLEGNINPYKEIDRTSLFIAQTCLDYDVVISRHFISSSKYKTGNTPFLHNVRREGITL